MSGKVAPFRHGWSRIYFYRQYSSHSGVTPPGLRFVPKLLSEKAEAELLQDANKLNQAIQEQALGAIERQARTYLSKQHNLPTKESYRLVAPQDSAGKTLNAQHFNRYGENGHQLTYFIGNPNIPLFVMDPLISSVEKLPELQALKVNMPQGQSLEWKFTFNVYSPDPERSSVAGFPYHMDTPSNGEVTAIFTLLNSAELQMKKDGDSTHQYSVMLTPGSLVLLSGEARWHWLHRVLPQMITAPNQPTSDLIHRMSLVIGCQVPKQ
jgi:alkylated DNA repair dioxygenase AlkB